ncbi:MAG TPA: cytochrome c3 family protein [Thermoanaerobaculia bacterium]|nr:cytochrome c3 family protein [Thermoanaerobaculia bacterium]
MNPAVPALFLLLAGQPWFKLPPHPRPEVFGNVLISRTTAAGPVKPAAFSHWSHRRRHTCRVCHLELEFSFKRNTTPITEEANRQGRFCGGCHDGKTAFAHTEPNCTRCHSGDLAAGAVKFGELRDLQEAPFGNGVDWSAALESGRIAPAASLTKGEGGMSLKSKLSLAAEWAMVPPAIFPHDEHTRWLDCANCHPEPFNIQKKTTKHFSMAKNLAGEFCGACHLTVAFPLDDCKRCHPKMRANS